MSIQERQKKKEEKINQLRNAISRIMRDFSMEKQCGIFIPERSYDAVKELILNEVKIRFLIAG